MASSIDLASYYTPLVTRLANALRTGFGARFKAVYEGEPLDVPVTMLPCIIVQKTDGDITQDATGIDQDTSTITVRVLLNKRTDFDSSKEKQFTHLELQRIIEGRDPSTLQYVSSSILGIIRTNFTLSNTIVDQRIRVNYRLAFRPKGVVSAEGQAVFTITELIQVPNRT